MAITYENVIYDRVIDSLHSLIADEFSVAIYYDEHKGNQSFLITPGVDNLVNLNSRGQARDYTVGINYQIQSGGNYTKNSVKQITEVSERLKRLIFNNSAYNSGSTYVWHDARVVSIEYDRSEDDSSLLNSLITFNCTVTESL